MPAALRADIPSILVSELYAKGAPRPGAVVERIFETTSRWRLRVTLTPFEDGVRAEMVRLAVVMDDPRAGERWADVEWQPWRFGSRRPWVLCALCGARCQRFFLYTRARLFGSIVCHRCAGVRYRSQDAGESERLILKIDKLRARLGGEPTGGRLGMRWPTRPAEMQEQTYFERLDELDLLERKLAAELGVPRIAPAKDPARRAYAWRMGLLFDRAEEMDERTVGG